ncbi:hypothetical protein ACKKBG_A13640 [Auxenochlorella protothecoides x Auxenochlorella symbiontica]
MVRDAIITSKMPEVMAEYESGGGPPERGACCSCRPESLARWVNAARFACVASLGLVAAASPWALATAEAVTMTLLYALTLPRKARDAPYAFAASAEDVLALSLLRAGLVLVCHFCGTGGLHQRPYLYAATALGCISLPLAMFKTAALEQGPLPPAKHPAFFLFFLLHAGFALAHMVAARQVSIWARRRHRLGLTGLGYPWEEGEETWLLAGELSARAELDALQLSAEDGGALLQASDSLFMTDCLGVTVHYRLVHPQGQPRATSTVILLLHGFGGGVFAWRHVMRPLADASGLSVLAFDRPGFGLTSRPPRPPDAPGGNRHNPYAQRFQARMTLELCRRLHIASLVLMGYGDGALLALRVASSCTAHRVAAPPGGDAGARSSTRDGSAHSQREGPALASSGTTGSPGTPPPPPWHAPAPLGHPPPGPRRGGPTSPDWAGSAPEQQALLASLLRGEFVPGAHWPLGTGAGVRAARGVVERDAPVKTAPGSWGSPASDAGAAVPSPTEPPKPAAMPRAAEPSPFLQAALEAKPAMQGSTGVANAAPSSEPALEPELERAPSILPPGPPLVRGVALLHPDISGVPAPLYARVLAQSRLGRRALAGLLRTEVGPVANRRAWADPAALTPEVLALYGAPRRLRAWDEALAATCRVPVDVHTADRNRLCARVRAPVCLLTGEADAFVTPAALAELARRFPADAPRVVLPRCGHVSHEEAPRALVQAMTAFLQRL